ncbi:AAA family ATPase [Thalassotalea crassostreae]|uniref:AAA family ATPase n=1 Tax=Thalassotalea crassostreae TaxID=1763536 RepID=UPI000ADDB541|nr:AAA family ATPase [Thalassotalea crassostreae]
MSLFSFVNKDGKESNSASDSDVKQQAAVDGDKSLDMAPPKAKSLRDTYVKGDLISNNSATNNHPTHEHNSSIDVPLNSNSIAPQPIDVKSTGLSENLLVSLLLKHLNLSGVLTIRQLSQKLCLPGVIVQTLIDKAKHQTYVENMASNERQQMRYALSSIGQLMAEKELLKNGYIGPAPVPIAQYTNICLQQSSRKHVVTLAELNNVFADINFSQDLLEKVGPSLNSNKPILIYGEAGTGKSYFCRHLNMVFGDEVLIPYALEVNSEVIQVFDPEIHHKIEDASNHKILKIAESFDQRWIKCTRPLVVSGGELTEQMLEVRFDSDSKTYQAPLQLKANNGILLLDDLGRQKISPKALFNRWIIPLEERVDYLALQSGQHFEIPFELVMLFSTNLSPTDLVDDAFLRRLGYKINFTPLSKELYQSVWFNECITTNLKCELSLFEYLVDHLHKMHGKKFLPCYPRDLTSIISDQIKFKQLDSEVTKELLDFAWHSYFVK